MDQVQVLSAGDLEDQQDGAARDEQNQLEHLVSMDAASGAIIETQTENENGDDNEDDVDLQDYSAGEVPVSSTALTARRRLSAAKKA